jgi:hypothetical protein
MSPTLRFVSASVGSLALSVALGSSSHADVTYNGFATTAGLTINGGAATANSADGTVLRLTPAIGNRGGSAFSTQKVSTSVFTSVFSFRISDSGGPVFDNNTESGADGLVFVVQNQANNVGSVGEGIGFSGISPSLGVEFDTWGNASNNDPSQSHVGIDLNGNVNHALAGQGPTVNIGDTNAATSALPGPELDSGVRWWSWVVYDAQTLSVYLTQNDSVTEPVRPVSPLLTFSVNLESTLGGSTAFAGFTSGTGSDFANHDILYWRYTETVPEPASLLSALAALGLAADGLRRARRR